MSDLEKIYDEQCEQTATLHDIRDLLTPRDKSEGDEWAIQGWEAILGTDPIKNREIRNGTMRQQVVGEIERLARGRDELRKELEVANQAVADLRALLKDSSKDSATVLATLDRVWAVRNKWGKETKVNAFDLFYDLTKALEDRT